MSRNSSRSSLVVAGVVGFIAYSTWRAGELQKVLAPLGAAFGLSGVPTGSQATATPGANGGAANEGVTPNPKPIPIPAPPPGLGESWGTGTQISNEPAPGNSRVSGGGLASYTIQPGDTLGSIAARYGTTVSALVELNRGGGAIGYNLDGTPNENMIYAGATLSLPV